VITVKLHRRDVVETRNSSVFLHCAKIFAGNAVVRKYYRTDLGAAIALSALCIAAGRRLYTKLSGNTVIFFSLV
jgi:hypothetical protein